MLSCFKKIWSKTDHTKQKHWKVVNKRDLPKGTIILPAVWSMKCKRHVATQQVYCWKRRLPLGGHKEIKGIHYKYEENLCLWNYHMLLLEVIDDKVIRVTATLKVYVIFYEDNSAALEIAKHLPSFSKKMPMDASR